MIAQCSIAVCNRSVRYTPYRILFYIFPHSVLHLRFCTEAFVAGASGRGGCAAVCRRCGAVYFFKRNVFAYIGVDFFLFTARLPGRSVTGLLTVSARICVAQTGGGIFPPAVKLPAAPQQLAYRYHYKEYKKEEDKSSHQSGVVSIKCYCTVNL